MLLVVAIIAVLIAISIPMVTGTLERVRVTTDAGNERVARSAAVAEYLMEGKFGGQDCSGKQVVVAFYDAAAGKWVNDSGSVSRRYGKCISTYGHEEGYLRGLLWQDQGEWAVYLRWEGNPSTSEASMPTGGLCSAPGCGHASGDMTALQYEEGEYTHNNNVCLKCGYWTQGTSSGGGGGSGGTVDGGEIE